MLSAGASHNCVVNTTGGAKCWGGNNHGQIGNDATDPSPPADVIGLTANVAFIHAGRSHSCALTNNGGAKCWGLNTFGRLGDGTNADQRLAPVDVIGLESDVASMTIGSDHTCALTTGGGVKCWGANNNSQLGNGTIGAGCEMQLNREPTPGCTFP
ncbi:MAG: hypothetical protein AAF702_00870 [Chloroflexota bacterium]